MTPTDVAHIAEDHLTRGKLTWDGDNSWFVAGWLVPNLKLSTEDKAVMDWAYGWPNGKSWEMESDGETLVKDWFMRGAIKNPAGVVHDALNRAPRHATPDQHEWTAMQSNALYRRVQRALGASLRLAWRRWAGLTISYWVGCLPGVPNWWRK